MRASVHARLVLTCLLLSCGRVGFEPQGIDGSIREGGTMDAWEGVDTGIDAPPCDGPRSVAEACNGLDDDCDNMVDEDFTLVTSADQCPGTPTPGNMYTVASITFDVSLSPTRGSLVTGDYENVAESPFSDTLAGFDNRLTVGYLVEGGPAPTRALHVLFPEMNGSLPEPDVTRCEILLEWTAGAGALNAAGPDVAVYEMRTREPYTVRVHTPDGTTSVRRYELVDFDDASVNVHVTLYELSDFGVPEGTIIDGIYIGNVFSSDAASGEDRVDDPSGHGVVFFAGEPGWDTGYPLLSEATGTLAPPLPVDIDPDPVFVVALHTVTSAPCCVRP